MKLLTTILAAAMIASVAHGQNYIGIVTDSNGVVVSSRSNTVPLVFSNPLTFGIGTNSTNGTLWDDGGLVKTTNVVGVPSGSATAGAVSTADGAGGSSFVASRVTTLSKPTSTSLTNDATATVSAPYDPHLQFTAEANTLYQVEGLLDSTSGAGNFKAAIAVPPISTFVANLGIIYPATALAIAAGSTATNPVFVLSASTPGTNAATTFVATFRTTTNGTIGIRWAQASANTNPTTLNAGSAITITKLAP